MKLKLCMVLMALLAVSAMVTSGCIGGNGNSATATPEATPVYNAGNVSATPAATPINNSNVTVTPEATPANSTGNATPTPAPTPVTPTGNETGAVTLSSLYKIGQFSWFEYRTKSNAAGNMTMDLKTEFLGKEMHNGSMADHLQTTTTVRIPGVPDAAPQITGYYVNLNDTSGSGQGNDFTSGERLVSADTDTVTVPAGTFACTKYQTTINVNGTQVTKMYWASTQVPVPVKFSTTAGSDTTSFELVGWG